MALGVALIALCFVLAISGAWAAAAGGNGVVAGIVIAAGIALIAGAFFGSWARWLILPALALALPAGVVAAADLDVRGGDRRGHVPPGQRRRRCATPTAWASGIWSSTCATRA